MRRTIRDVDVHGVDVDGETRCAHYASERDVIALRFSCCDDYFPCYQCHEAVADHDAAVWPPGAVDTDAILCGRCGTELAIRTYLTGDNCCSACGAEFNPGCRRHTHRYFSDELVRQATREA